MEHDLCQTDKPIAATTSAPWNGPFSPGLPPYWGISPSCLRVHGR